MVRITRIVYSKRGIIAGNIGNQSVCGYYGKFKLTITLDYPGQPISLGRVTGECIDWNLSHDEIPVYMLERSSSLIEEACL